MAYTDDAVLAKLSALNETQESIVSSFPDLEALQTLTSQVTVAQWVMFHRFANTSTHASLLC